MRLKLGAPLSEMMLALAILGSFSMSSAFGQTEPQSPAELIKYLTYQSDRPFALDCGTDLAEARHQRALTRSLVKMRTSAVPAIEEAIDSFEARGEKSAVGLHVGWLLFAYAEIEGPAAYPRLHRLIRNRPLGSFTIVVDNSMALAFGLTSYVSSSRTTLPAAIFRCDRFEEPRDALDTMILAWEKDDAESLKATLGPTASSALTELLKGRTWADLRSTLWHDGSQKGTAVGYRFDLPGRWSEPEETLEDHRSRGDVYTNYDGPATETSFTSPS